MSQSSILFSIILYERNGQVMNEIAREAQFLKIPLIMYNHRLLYWYFKVFLNVEK